MCQFEKGGNAYAEECIGHVTHHQIVIIFKNTQKT